MDDKHPWKNLRMAIKCCSGCKPPKRYPGCGSHCKEYIEEKAKHVANKNNEKEYLRNHPPMSVYDFNKG